MNFFAFIPLLSCFINITLWVLIFSKRLYSKTSYAYLYYVGAMGLFQWFEFMIYTVNTVEQAALLLRLQCIFWIPMGVLFVNFVYSLFDYEKSPTLFVLWIPTIFCVLTAVFTSFVTQGATSYLWGYDHDIGVLFIPVVFLITIGPALYGLFLIVRQKFDTQTPPMLKQQCAYILIGSSAALILGVFFDVLLPYVFMMDSMIRVSTSAVVIQTLFIYLAVRRYHLMWVSLEDAAGYIFRNVQDGILVLDNKNRIQLANQSAILALHLDYAELYNFPITSIFDQDTYSPTGAYHNQTFVIERAGKEVKLSLTQSIVKNWQNDLGKVLIIKEV